MQISNQKYIYSLNAFPKYNLSLKANQSTYLFFYDNQSTYLQDTHTSFVSKHINNQVFIMHIIHLFKTTP